MLKHADSGEAEDESDLNFGTLRNIVTQLLCLPGHIYVPQRPTRPYVVGTHRFSPSSSHALTELSRDGLVCCAVSSDAARSSAESSDMRGMSICAGTALDVGLSAI